MRPIPPPGRTEQTAPSVKHRRPPMIGRTGIKCPIASRNTGKVSRGDFETLRHVAQLRVVVLIRFGGRADPVPRPCRTWGNPPDDPAGPRGASGRCKPSSARVPRRVAFQRHAAFRAIAGFVRFHAGAHRAEVFRGGGWRHRGVIVMIVRFPPAAGRRFCRMVVVGGIHEIADVSFPESPPRIRRDR
jgi:hypothetical protein